MDDDSEEGEDESLTRRKRVGRMRTMRRMRMMRRGGFGRVEGERKGQVCV